MMGTFQQKRYTQTPVNITNLEQRSSQEKLFVILIWQARNSLGLMRWLNIWLQKVNMVTNSNLNCIKRKPLQSVKKLLNCKRIFLGEEHVLTLPNVLAIIVKKAFVRAVLTHNLAQITWIVMQGFTVINQLSILTSPNARSWRHPMSNVQIQVNVSITCTVGMQL